MVKTPDFIIVGAPKCGTTALDDYLGQHPQIFMAPQKESHHFATDLIPADDFFRSAQNYSALFDDARPGQLLGEASVHYLYSADAAYNIHRANPRAKIIAMVRNPVEQIAANHSQLLYTASEHLADLEAALAAEEPRKSGAMPLRPDRFSEKLFYRDMVRYAEQIQRYIELFGREQVHVIVYDDLRSDTPGVYRDTLRFLGVDPTFQPAFQVVNPNKRSRSRAVQGLLKEPPALLRATARLLPAGTRSGLKRLLRRAITKYEPRPPMRPELRARLQRELAPEVERLGKLLGRDLSAWNKP